ncbi:hypothetical protein [Saccharothrix algeriensis]|uniref:Uncharacterized protein n=1 Tax=Saccharothrix algeriensis TaxID=173560 RepID=A0ABS2SD33_9PSEU|nr:hypothetical protein [Saccharothrix algeriensis]MBM7813870.1 hypothetical protein [Saccharothrix algeriensis]
MNDPEWGSDEVLLRELAEALAEARTVPEEFVEAGRAAFAWRTVDAELVVLLTSYDSTMDPELANRARAALTARQLVFDAGGSFEGGARGAPDKAVEGAPGGFSERSAEGNAEGNAERISVQVEVTEAGVAGQVLPARQGRVALFTAGGPVEEAELDELGCFLLGPPPPGPVRFRIEADGTTMVTEWICV